MLKDVMGLLNLHRQEEGIQRLTMNRSLAALPFGGRYRLIDFPLSSMVNSGIRNVGVLLPENSRSILDHLRSGKDWSLARHHKGLFYLPPARAEQGGADDLRNIYSNLDFVEQSSETYILLARAIAVYNMNFIPMIEEHIERGADITLVTSPQLCDDVSENLVIRNTEKNGRIRDIALQTNVKKGEQRSFGVYFLKKRLFIELVREACEHGGTDFRVDVILRAAHEKKLYEYRHTGYACRICSLAGYYATNQAILRPDIWRELFFRKGAGIYTKVKDMAPARYLDGAHVVNSVVANGCEIAGTVENSILFRGVHVEPGAIIRNSIVMQNSIIGAHAAVDCVITDKNVTITAGKAIHGADTYPVYIEKNQRI